MITVIDIETGAGDALVDITARARAAVAASGVAAGLCVLIVPHTTAGILINSNLDMATPADLLAEIQRLVPKRVDFAPSV